MSQVKLTKGDFEDLQSIVNKKLRNKKKKMEKIVATENKIVAKEIDPTEEQLEMVASKEKIENQIKEFEDMKKQLKQESNKILAKHQEILQNMETGAVKEEEVVRKALHSIADALLVNSLQNNYGVQNLLDDDNSHALEALLVPLKNLVNPPSESLKYDRALD